MSFLFKKSMLVYWVLVGFFFVLIKFIQIVRKSKSELIIENLALRQQLAIYQKITSYKSPWQNGICERFILSARSEVLNHVVVFNEDHLWRLIREYVEYYNNGRCHLSLDRDSPLGRKVQQKLTEFTKVISTSKLGGLQHRYEWKKQLKSHFSWFFFYSSLR